MRVSIITHVGTDVGSGIEELGEILVAAGWQVEWVAMDLEAPLAPEVPRDEIGASFAHTPQPLIDSWEFATRVLRYIADTGPDVVIVGDRDGLGGVLALELGNGRTASSPRLWTFAGRSLSLARLHVADALATSTLDEVSKVDWELTQYRFSDRVVCASYLVRELLSRVGIDADVVPIAATRVETVSRPARRVFVPGPASRINATPQILRATVDMADVSVVFGIGEADDEYWVGSTWEAFEATRALAGGRVSRRGAMPPDTDLLVIGDPFLSHRQEIEAALKEGIVAAVPSGSVDSLLWRGLPEWSSDDDLASIIVGDVVGRSGRDTPTFDLVRRIEPDMGRASKVTIGIPVFGTSPFLEELLESIARQTVAPHEVVVMVDGPRTAAVDSAIAKWREVIGGGVRVDQQPNRGVCVARNAIMDGMTGDALLLVDQDDVLVPEALERFAQALRSNPGCGAAAAWTAFFGDYDAIEGKPPFDARVGSRENPIVSTAVLIDASIVASGLRFEADLAFLYCEDWNLWADIVAHGGSFALVARPLVRHRVHRSSGGFRRDQLALEAGKRRVQAKLCS